MKIGFLGFGEAARAFQESLAAEDPNLSFSAWDIKLATVDTAEAMQAAMAARTVAEVTAEGLAEADWIFSAVTADQSLIALQSIKPYLRQGQLIVDINSVSPDRKRQSAALVEESQCHYLDMAVMAPVHPNKHRTPVIIAGRCLDQARPTLERYGFAFSEARDEPGRATAIKMVRSLFVKGLEAITVETLLAAKASGCFEEITASLSKSYPGLGWSDFANYELERTLHHGTRRAAEMRESAATISALGLNGNLANEIANVQAEMGAAGRGGMPDSALEDLISEVLKRRAAADSSAKS